MMNRRFLFIAIAGITAVTTTLAQPKVTKYRVGFEPSDSLSWALAKGVERDGQEIRIGDQVPERSFKMLNYKSDSLKLSDLRGKWVILDFWSNGCGSCLAAMPRLEKLQESFGDQIRILPITFQSAAFSAAKLNEIAAKIGPGVKISSIVEDTITYSLFSSYSNPLEVWIDPNGKLAAITWLEYVTRENIQAAIDGKPLDFPDFSLKKPWTTPEDKATKDTVYFGSVLREQYTNNFRSHLLRTAADAENIRGTYANICSLYQEAYKYMDSAQFGEITYSMVNINKRIVANFNVNRGPDSAFHPGSYSPKNSRNSVAYKEYCYELTMPAGSSKKQLGRKMVSDLDCYFHIESSIQRRRVKTLALVKSPGFQALPPTQEADAVFEGNGKWMINNDEIRNYLERFNEANSYTYSLTPLIIYDKTGIKGKIHLPIHWDGSLTLDQLRKQLQACHLDIVPGEEKEMNMLILTME